MPVDTLAEYSIFRGVSDSYLQHLLDNYPIFEFKAEEFIFRQGDKGNGIYVVLEGKLMAMVNMLAAENPNMFMIDQGSFFGEVSVLTTANRTASVKAVEHSRLLFLDKDLFAEEIKRKEVNALLITYNAALTLAERFKKVMDLVNLFNSTPKINPVNEFAKYREQLLSDGLI